VQSRHPLGPAARRSQLCDHQRRCVAGEDGFIAQDGFQLHQQLVLDLQVLGYRLDRHVGASQLRQLGARLQPADRRFARRRGHLALLGGAPQHAGGEVHTGLRPIERDVEHLDPVAGGRGDLGDAPAHDAGADDGDALHGLTCP
jgi:hypothetical protein